MYTYLMQKLSMDVDIRKVPAMCCWSDLLGFGSSVSENNWNPTDEGWKTIANRLRIAQTICAQSYSIGEFVFVSNDGLIRSLDLSNEPGRMDFFSLWFRSLILYHISLNTVEHKKGFPGARTVVAGGDRLLHNWDKFTFADLLYHFEGRETGKGSSYDEYNQQIIMENPLPLQMNTAFSKAYILDDGGKKQGLPGNNFYIEQNTLELLKHYSEMYNDQCSSYTWVENDEHILFSIPKKGNEDLFHLGFELSKPITFEHKGLNTLVYKLNKFYPWDEDPREFSISLDEPNIYFVPIEQLRKITGTNSVLTYPQGPKYVRRIFKIVEVDSLDDVEE